MKLKITPADAPGPWGQAIKHWLVVRNQRQSDLARATGMGTKTISSLVRGHHTTTRALTKIAAVLKIPVSELFVQSQGDRRRLIVDITQVVLREVEARQRLVPSLDEAVEAFAQAVETETVVATIPPTTVAADSKDRRRRRR